jgi:hypothetical protein
MRRAIFAMLLLAPALSACDFTGQESRTVETKIDDLDSVEGTISDEMIDTDMVDESPAIEAAAPTDGAKPAATKGDPKEAAKESKSEAKSADSNAATDADQ